MPPGTDFVLTGPEAPTMTDMAAVLSDVLGTAVTYQDMPEDDFSQVRAAAAGHVRAGGGDRRRLAPTGLAEGRRRRAHGHLPGAHPCSPTYLQSWVQAHRSAFKPPTTAENEPVGAFLTAPDAGRATPSHGKPRIAPTTVGGMRASR